MAISLHLVVVGVLTLAASWAGGDSEVVRGCPQIKGCRCNEPQMLWCKGSADDLPAILEGLNEAVEAQNLTMLDLSLTNLTVIQKDFFNSALASKLPLLKGIYISGGPVTTIEDGAFSGIEWTL